jgi:aspartokinase
MTSITKQVWEILDNDPTIQRDLARGIVNVSALAQYLKETHRIEGSIDSLVSGIRRYRTGSGAHDDYARIGRTLQDAVLSTKTGISMVRLHNTPSVYKYLTALMQHEDFIKNDVFRLFKTRHDVQVIVDRDSMAKAKSLFPASAVEETRTALVELDIRLTQKGWETPGVLSRITNELALQGINIVMVFSVYPTITLFLEQKDLLRAHEALVRISQKKER